MLTCSFECVVDARVGGAANANKMAQSVGKLKMRSDEAYKILNIDASSFTPTSPLTAKAIEEIYLKHSANNDPAKGGSFYLQSKIFRAKESLEREIGHTAKADDTVQATSDSDSGGEAEEKESSAAKEESASESESEKKDEKNRSGP